MPSVSREDSVPGLWYHCGILRERKSFLGCREQVGEGVTCPCTDDAHDDGQDEGSRA